jgi:hypothetical protein
MGNHSEGKFLEMDVRCTSCDDILIGDDERYKLICGDCEKSLTNKSYHVFLLSMGYKLDWTSCLTVLQYSNDDTYIEVLEKEDGYHDFAMCPKKCFDKWGNSRHIKWRLMVENCTEEKPWGWTSGKVKEDFEKNVNDAQWFCFTVPERMFSSFIKIEL